MQNILSQGCVTRLDSASHLDRKPSLNTSPKHSCVLDLDCLTLLEEIGSSKATVFLAYLPSLDQYVAVKAFPYEQRRANKYFLNEVKFVHLEHPNIISYIHKTSRQRINISKGLSISASLIIMELASQGDLLNTLVTQKVFFDTIVARTYFHQLIAAVEYMHSNGVAHQDLKLDNLLLSENFQLKVSDFDVAWSEDEAVSQNTGTLFYRAPEVCTKTCEDPKKADIYSAGILLFLFRCGGVLPHLEDQLYNGTSLRGLLENHNELFWEKHSEIQGRPSSFFDEDFKSLFNGMVCADPAKRYTIEQIKSSRWYQGEIYSRRKLASKMMDMLK